MNEPHCKGWVNGIIAKLELLDTECGHIGRNERLEYQDLNRILDLFDSARGKFLIMCELHGFKVSKSEGEK